ncbi:alpha/beta hydrolase [Persicimonas caeni]|uniref:Alpha/beta hydrolase n=1 Tax=Persicimonas caeni TaxID=2292766 RepID=A0A4Y6PYR2_PERCE|nr:alpha/beta hydrolase [Persicimonas caeni]QDG53461.1 alpha/beta hydrolase [Persicimonas caeni]QED34682.1 alpha/beta hydrolase [Persicimonas caeni]
MIHTLQQLLDRPRPWRHLHHPPALAERHEVTTRDGLRLHLRRVRRLDAKPDRPAVMLLHGLAANHRGLHFGERSLAEWLADRGFDVWLPELRGHGDSDFERYDWRIDHYLEHDIPAILEGIRRLADVDLVHWVGHSMGGVLLMCYGILQPEAPIARGVAVGSALDYSVGETGFKQLLKIRGIIERMGSIPYGMFMHLIAPAMGRGLRPLEVFNVWPSNIEPEMLRALHATCFHAIPTSLLGSLATTFEPDGLSLQNGFRFVPNAPEFPFPIRLLAGSKDAQVSVDAIVHTADLLGDNAEAIVHGPERGDNDHYGHWDLLIGRRAPIETWPSIAHWLESDD